MSGTLNQRLVQESHLLVDDSRAKNHEGCQDTLKRRMLTRK